MLKTCLSSSRFWQLGTEKSRVKALWVYTGWGLCDLNPLGVQETIGTGRGRRVPAKRAAPCLGCLRGAGHGLPS